MPTASEDMATVKSEMIRIRSDLDKILKILVEGNGHSLVSKMAVVESKLEDFEVNFEDTQKYSGAVRLAILSACLSLFTSVGAVLFQVLVKKP